MVATTEPDMPAPNDRIYSANPHAFDQTAAIQSHHGHYVPTPISNRESHAFVGGFAPALRPYPGVRVVVRESPAYGMDYMTTKPLA